MSAPSYRNHMALAALFNLPKTLRDDVVDLPGFKTAFDIPAEAEITFGSGLRFLRSKLFIALRALYADKKAIQTIETEDGDVCELTLKTEGDQPAIICSVGEQQHVLPSFAMVSANVDERLAEFDRIVRRNNLLDPSTAAWRKRLAENVLIDEEMSELMRDLDQNPFGIRQKIREQIQTGSASIATLIPSTSAYYDRLIGSSSMNTDLVSFIQNSCKSHIDGLMKWEFARGLSFALLVAGHSTISELIDIGDCPVLEVKEAFAWLADRGDRFSQIAGVELGIRIIEKYPEIETYLISIIEEMRDEDTSATDSRFGLTANLFVLVDGELSRSGILREKPPFWRRLAAIAQSSLIERELILAGLNVAEFMERGTMGRGGDFYIQALADLRIEPRWLPDFMHTERLKEEAISRLVIAGEKLGCDAPQRLRALLKGDGPNGLRAHVSFPQSFLPGPLEGNTVPGQEMPAELVNDLRNHPDASLLSARSLVGLINSALVFRIGPEHARLAAETLKKVRHQVAMNSDDGESFSVLAGLASVAAVTRNVDLARDVRILARMMRRRIGTHFGVKDLMRVGLIASAANCDVDDWSKTVGEWFVEIAQEPMSSDDASGLRTHLKKLCDIVPELWRFSGKADAALAAITQTN